MASNGKKKTTMGKLNRERKLHERRIDKQARKEARKLAAADPNRSDEVLTDDFDGLGPESSSEFSESDVQPVPDADAFARPGPSV
jgi:hypothetical protein